MKRLIMFVLCFALCAGLLVFGASAETAYTVGGFAYASADGVYWFPENGIAEITPAEGYSVSASEAGAYGSSLTLGSTNGKTIWLKHENASAQETDLSGVLMWDTAAPSGEITLPDWEKSWTSLAAEMTYDAVCWEAASVKVEAADSESGIASVEYFVADSLLSEAEIIAAEWAQYTQEITLPENQVSVVYARFTDHVGNVSYISTGGIVCYTSPGLADEVLEYYLGDPADLTTKITLNGSTVGSVTLNEEALQEGTDYVLGEDGALTFKAGWLESLSAGEHTVSVSVLPLGIETAEPDGVVIFLDVRDWGTAVRFGSVTNYVASSGVTSAAVSVGAESSLTWAREESGGMSAWFGVDDAGEVFPDGSRFWVQWLNPASDKTAWEQKFAAFDEIHRSAADTENVLMFNIGVTDTDGTPFGELAAPVQLYVQLDDGWDADRLHAAYIQEGTDETLLTSAISAESPGGSGKYAVLTLNHFSTYVIYLEAEQDAANDGGNAGGAETGGSAGAPKTGDESRLFLWVTVTAVTAAGSLLLTGKLKKRT